MGSKRKARLHPAQQRLLAQRWLLVQREARVELEVHVRVDQAGHDRAVSKVAPRIAAPRRRQLRKAASVHDPAALDRDTQGVATLRFHAHVRQPIPDALGGEYQAVGGASRRVGQLAG